MGRHPKQPLPWGLFPLLPVTLAGLIGGGLIYTGEVRAGVSIAVSLLALFAILPVLAPWPPRPVVNWSRRQREIAVPIVLVIALQGPGLAIAGDAWWPVASFLNPVVVLAAYAWAPGALDRVDRWRQEQDGVQAS